MLDHLTPNCAPAAIGQQYMVRCWAHDDLQTQVHAKVLSMNRTHKYFETNAISTFVIVQSNFILHSFPHNSPLSHLTTLTTWPLDVVRF